MDAPASAIARSDAGFVEMFGDRFDAHWPRRAVPLARQAEDQPHGFGLNGINLQCLLRAMAALLSTRNKTLRRERWRSER
jgi:hypothetical protein